jgi:hypothetical protein
VHWNPQAYETVFARGPEILGSQLANQVGSNTQDF